MRRMNLVLVLALMIVSRAPAFGQDDEKPWSEQGYCGLALRDILADAPERIIIYASGGLSHDPRGPRAGWVDEPLDHWVLERIKRNEGEKLVNLFSFDSDTLRGGTGEIRAWIAGAAIMQRPGTVLDYFPSHHAKCGLAFAYWPEEAQLEAAAQ